MLPYSPKVLLDQTEMQFKKGLKRRNEEKDQIFEP